LAGTTPEAYWQWTTSDGEAQPLSGRGPSCTILHLEHPRTANPIDPGAFCQVLGNKVRHLVSEREPTLDRWIRAIDERHAGTAVGDQGSTQPPIVMVDLHRDLS
jgi:hypothetical protein